MKTKTKRDQKTKTIVLTKLRSLNEQSGPKLETIKKNLKTPVRDKMMRSAQVTK